MGRLTGVQWTHHTFNPWWGCTRVSEACRYCYAETWARRTGYSVWGHLSPRRFFDDPHWAEPLIWDRAARAAGKRRRVFCASMADVFEDRRDLDEHRDRLWSLIESTPNLVWLLLTKRPEQISAMVPWEHRWPDHVKIGCTVEDQGQVRRVNDLAKVPAGRFLSCEPLLSSLDLRPFASAIDWLIAGGESGGRHVRASKPQWFRDLRDFGAAERVPFFFKQWGDFDEAGRWVGKKVAGRVLDGCHHNAIPAGWGAPVREECRGDSAEIAASAPAQMDLDLGQSQGDAR